MTDTIAAVTKEIEAALARTDVETVRREYWAQDEALVLERWLGEPLIRCMLHEVDGVRTAIHRNYIPRHKKGGSVSYYTLLERAPTIVALYRSPALLHFLETLTGQALQPCPDNDPHSCALYFYTEPGDHIGFHFDTSYYKGTRYTMLVGLVERSSSRLLCQFYRADAQRRAVVERAYATEPGTVVVFNGDKLWHAISPLGTDEERVSLTLEYVTNPSMTPLKRLFSNLKDAFAYFGVRAVFGMRRPRGSTRGLAATDEKVE